MLSTNLKCTEPFYFPLLLKPAAQKMKKMWSYSIWCSRQVIATSRLRVELWCLFAVMLLRVFDLVFCKTLFGNKYYILWHWLFRIHFLYGICVNLILTHTYYGHSVWPYNWVWHSDIIAMSTIGMLAQLEESYFTGYFTNKTIFILPLFKTSCLLLIFSAIFLFLAPLLWKKRLLTFSQAFQNFVVLPL
jgi:hypothetical protein